MKAGATKIVYRIGEEGTEADILEAGGKGANLSRLAQSGFPVPEGFIVSAGAYREATRGLEGAIREALGDRGAAFEPGGAARASRAIGELILGGGLSAETAAEIGFAYRELCGSAGPGGEPADGLVAVRSSATAEDLPDLSFAGQQDSYLDVGGEAAVLDAVLRCWASLWTERAIEYRRRAGLEAELPSIAVVVQRMVVARAAGVMFTADPVEGSRSRVLIEAVRGLGDAFVSGQASPDRYAIRDSLVAESELAGEEAVLSEEEAVELARLGRSVEESFSSGEGSRGARPQDIEWARSGGRFFLLQSRPITSLFPLPEDGRPCSWLYSFGAWQGYLEPFTPLGREAMLGVVAGAARLFGLKVDTETQGAFREAGERLWVELGPLFGRKAGRTFMDVFLGSIDPSAAAIVEALEAEGALPLAQEGLPLGARLGLARFAPKVGFRVMRNLARPAAGRERLSRAIDRGSREAAALLSRAGGGAEVAAAMRGLAEELAPSILPVLLGGIVSSQVPFQVLLRLAREAGAEDEALELTRGLSHNVTTEMDLALWDAAEAIRSDPSALEACARLDARGFSSAYRALELPKAAQDAFGSFIERYGFRGAGEIDIGMPRWREDPAAVAGALLSYLSIDAEASPRAIFEKGARRAAEAARRVEEAIRKAQGPLKGRLARFLAGRLRELGGLRESPKYGIMRILGELRSSLLAEGERLAQAGRIEEAGDIFFLRGSEIAGSGSLELKRLVEERKASREREMRRVRVPRLLAGDGRAWYDAPSKAEEGSRSLRGSPVSPGVAEGRARVVFDPAKAALEKGDILVCRATDPAWTPLFLAAAALVTEVGGQMTHGSVVAREYGIPAVVGVADATSRIADLSRIRVDGAAGLVLILEEADGGQPPGMVPSSP